jgi:acetyl-CoA carboxylase carboxyl transferase subunit alpha
LGGAHRDAEASSATVKEALLRNLKELQAMPPADLVKKRYDKFRAIGRFETTQKARLSARRKTKVKSKE